MLVSSSELMMLNTCTLRLVKIILVFLITASLGACANNQLHKKNFEPPVYEVPPPAPPSGGSIFSSQYNLTLFRDVTASQVGDLITIILVEETTASKSADISTEKDTSISIPNPTILGRAANLITNRNRSLETTVDTENEFEGAGSANQSNRLDGRVTVVVEKVLPNGNLVIRGQKLISINQGDEFVRVTGLIRPQDITGENTILSTQVANAHFSYGGRGVIADSQAQGWLARFFNSPYWPF